MMAWKEVSAMSQRVEFVVLASAEGAHVSELCRRFGVSRVTSGCPDMRLTDGRGWLISLVGRRCRRGRSAVSRRSVCWRCR